MKRLSGILAVTFLLSLNVIPIAFAFTPSTWDVDAQLNGDTGASPYGGVASLSDFSSLSYADSMGSSNWQTDGSAGRLYRASGSPYITYAIKDDTWTGEGDYLDIGKLKDIGYFEVLYGSQNSPGPKFTITTSTNGEDFESIALNEATKPGPNTAWTQYTVTPGTAIPEGVKYLRVTFSASVTTQLQLGHVKITAEKDDLVNAKLELMALIDQAKASAEFNFNQTLFQASADEYRTLLAKIAEAEAVYADSEEVGVITATTASLQTAFDSFLQFLITTAAAEVWDIHDSFNQGQGLDSYPWSAISEKSTAKNTFLFTNSSQPWADDDTHRIYKATGNPTSYLTYAINGSDELEDIAYFRVTHGRNTDNSHAKGSVHVFISEDGEVFTPFTANYAEVGAGLGWGNNRRVTVTPGDSIPPGTKYIRFQIGGIGQTFTNTHTQLMGIRISSQRNSAFEQDIQVINERNVLNNQIGAAKTYAASRDDGVKATIQYAALQTAINDAETLYNASYVSLEEITTAKSNLTTALEALKNSIAGQNLPFSHNADSLAELWDFNNLRLANSATIGTTITPPTENDATRVVKVDDGIGHALFKLNDSFKYFKIVGIIRKSPQGNLPEDFTFQTWNGTDSQWSDAVDIMTTRHWNDSSWSNGEYRNIVYEGYNIPDDARYLRVNFAITPQNVDYYANAIFSVYISDQIEGTGIVARNIAVTKNDEGVAVPIESTATLAQGGEITFAADIHNYKETSGSAHFIATVYDNGVVKGVGFVDEEFGGRVVIQGINLPSDMTAPYIKLFVWESMESLRALVNSIPIRLASNFPKQ